MRYWTILLVTHVWVPFNFYCKAKPINPAEKELHRVKRLEVAGVVEGESNLGPSKNERLIKQRNVAETEQNVHLERFFGSKKKLYEQKLPLRSSRVAREDNDVTSRKNQRFGIQQEASSDISESEDENVSTSAFLESEDKHPPDRGKRSVSPEIDDVVKLANALDAIAINHHTKRNYDSFEDDVNSASSGWESSTSGSNENLVRTLKQHESSYRSTAAEENIKSFFASNLLEQEQMTPDSGSAFSGSEEETSPLDAMEKELQFNLAESEKFEDSQPDKTNTPVDSRIVRGIRSLESSKQDFIEFVRYLKDKPAADEVSSTSEFQTLDDQGSADIQIISDVLSKPGSATNAEGLDESTLVKRFYRDQETKTVSSSTASLPSKNSEVIEEGEINSDSISTNLKEQLSVPRVVYKKEITEQESSLVEMPAVYSRSEEKMSENDGMDSSDGGLDPDEPNIEIHERRIREDGYLGCYEDESPERDLPYAVSVSELTPASCRLSCRMARYAYAGVQYGYLCRCGNSYGRYRQLDEKLCSTKCKGDQSQICGGFYKSSIFTTDGASDSLHGNFFQVENVHPLVSELDDNSQPTEATANFNALETNPLPPLAVSSQADEMPVSATSTFTSPEENHFKPLPPLLMSTYSNPDKNFNQLPPLAVSTFTKQDKDDPVPPSTFQEAPTISDNQEKQPLLLSNSSLTTPKQYINETSPFMVSLFTQPQNTQVTPPSQSVVSYDNVSDLPAETPPAPYIATANVRQNSTLSPANVTFQALSSFSNKTNEAGIEVPDPSPASLTITDEGATELAASSPDSNPKTLERKSKIPEQKTNTVGMLGHVSKWMYLHPQNNHENFRSKLSSPTEQLLIEPGTKVYEGSIKMKQSWTDDLTTNKSAKYQILAGNIEHAFKDIFKSNKKFLKAKVLGFSEGLSKHNPATVTKVVARFALTFEENAKDDPDIVKKLVREHGKLLDMPVYGDSVNIAEFNDNKNKVNVEDTNGDQKHTDKTFQNESIEEKLGITKKSEVAKRNDVDPFLLEVFSYV